MISLTLIAAAAAEEAGHEAAKGGLFADTSFWVLLAFIIVIGIFARAGLHKTMAVRPR